MTALTTGRGHRAAGIYQDLRQRIDQGMLEPGDRLPTQRDLATEFGASITTVNKAVSRLRREKRVWAQQGSGVFVAEATSDSAMSKTIAYMYMDDFQQLVPIQHAALQRGCLLSVYSQLQSSWNPQAERLFLQQVRDQRHMALLAFCSPTEPRNDDLLREISQAGTRVIHLEHYREELPEQEYLLPDYRRAARMAAVDLALAGYQHIFYYGHAEGHTPANALIHRGLREARDDYGVPLAENYLLERPVAAPDFVEVLAKCFAVLPENCGLVLAGDGHVHRIVKALAKLGKRVPDDVGLLTVELPLDTGTDVDRLCFDRQRGTRRAIESIVGEGAPLHELVGPVRQRHGLVRETP